MLYSTRWVLGGASLLGGFANIVGLAGYIGDAVTGLADDVLLGKYNESLYLILIDCNTTGNVFRVEKAPNGLADLRAR